MYVHVCLWLMSTGNDTSCNGKTLVKLVTLLVMPINNLNLNLKFEFVCPCVLMVDVHW